jgi:hypothetical protein
MSNLTVGLAIIGGLLLAAVVAHGAWTSRRNTPRQASTEESDTLPPGGYDEAFTGTERNEPTFDPLPIGAEGGAHSDADGGNLIDPMLGKLPAPEKKPGLDALIDVIANIALDNHVSGEAAIAAMPPTRRAGSKPFAVEGLNEATRQWETPENGAWYEAFQAGVQLANRTGALNEIEYSEFVMKAQAFADTINGTPDFPEMLDEVARGRELDQFASSHDAQLSFTLRARSAAWSPGYVHQNAARLGFVAGVIPGRMVLSSAEPGLPPLLGLSFDTQAAMAEDPAQSAIREVTLSLDVPQVYRTEQPFVRMREAAQILAEGMDGVITDDNGHILQPEAMDVIGADLEKLYDTLDARDLSAGSVLARRLFS